MRKAVETWERFWFREVESSTYALLRVAFAVVVLAWTISLAPTLYSFFGDGGILPSHPDGDVGSWGLLQLDSGPAAVTALYLLLLVGALCLLVGFKTRLAAVVVFVCLVSFARRDPWVLNSGDLLVIVLSFYVMLTPSGAALSVDRWLEARTRFWEFPKRSLWPLRLIQVQVSLLYFFAVWAKVRGETWNDGTAVSYAFRIEDLERFPIPAFVTDSLLLVNLITYGTLAVELALAILVWNGKLRPWVLLLGVMLHLGIDYAVRVGFFSYAALVAYIAFLPPETVSAWVHRLRDRMARSRLAWLVPSVEPVEPEGRP
ncbi:MAG TPA: HTTM domain-containing protein [Gaiellaceae bacterium]|nr:HTTM domain-containing protein [Gaiellaceae bacterium]